MSDSNRTIMATSQEFIDLCRGQIALLTQVMGASWSAVYVTPNLVEYDRLTKLIQVVAYPEQDRLRSENNRLEILPRFWDRLQKTPSLPSAEGTEDREKKNPLDFTANKSYLVRQRQLVLPLIYQETVMGLLVTRRSDREWNEQEYDRIEKIATTIAIGCRLARERDWYREKLDRQPEDPIATNQLEDLLHQLRNPITALRTFSKLLLKRFTIEDRNRTIAQNMLEQSDRLEEIIEGFQKKTSLPEKDLTVLSPTQKLPSLPPKIKNLPTVPVKIAEILNPILAAAVAIARERNISLNSNIPINLPPIEANARALREVFSNLIDNALKYTPSGGKIEIEAGISRYKNDTHWLGIAIRDTGMGIPKQDRQRIFERHYRGVQAKGNIKGTGLGLAIAKELIERMSGEIELVSSDAEKELSGLAIKTSFIIWLKAIES
ncbi:MAG: ATP-binding protein [Prochloraceae cyanobacterium]